LDGEKETDIDYKLTIASLLPRKGDQKRKQ